MLVEHVTALPEGEEWEYEYSWPGERVLAAKDGSSVRLTSVLHRRDLTNRFPVVAAAIAKLNAETAVLDGVVRAIDGVTISALLGGSAAPIPTGGIRLIATDILWFDTIDARQLILSERKLRLREVTQGTGILVCAPTRQTVAQMIAGAEELGADGVIAKRRDSRYRPFARAGDWLRLALPSASATARAKAGTDAERDRASPRAPLGGWGHAMT